MAEQRNPELPDGTDTVIETTPEIDSSGSIETSPVGGDSGNEGTVAIGGPSSRTGDGGGSSSTSGAGSSSANIADRFRSSREQLTSQAGEKARGLVTQGLERTSEALANVSKMVGDTADGIEERLGPEYGDYARRAAGAIENVANTIAEKDPDELIEDTRTFVRNSPGIALAGAAVVGFVLARLVKSGIAANNDHDDEA
jgi:ElaB/YqjD/DUF883 family membrane-anchored ribosome-binding protein